MERKLSAMSFIQMMEHRDHPDERHHIVPGADAVAVRWNEEGNPNGVGAGCGRQLLPDDRRGLRATGTDGRNIQPHAQEVPPGPRPWSSLTGSSPQSSTPYLLYAMQGNQIVHWVRSGNTPETCSALVRYIGSAMDSFLANLEVHFFNDTIDSTLFNVVDTTKVHKADDQTVCFGIAVQNSLSWSHALRLSAYSYHPEEDVGAITGRYFDRYTRRRSVDQHGDWVSRSLESILHLTHKDHIPNFQRLNGPGHRGSEQHVLGTQVPFPRPACSPQHTKRPIRFSDCAANAHYVRCLHRSRAPRLEPGHEFDGQATVQGS